MAKDLAADRAKEEKKKLIGFYKKLFEKTDDNRAGLAVLEDLFSFCGMDRSSFCPGDPYSMAFNEGARRVFLRIMGMLRMNVTDVEELMKKLKEKERERFEW